MLLILAGACINVLVAWRITYQVNRLGSALWDDHVIHDARFSPTVWITTVATRTRGWCRISRNYQMSGYGYIERCSDDDLRAWMPDWSDFSPGPPTEADAAAMTTAKSAEVGEVAAGWPRLSFKGTYEVKFAAGGPVASVRGMMPYPISNLHVISYPYTPLPSGMIVNTLFYAVLLSPCIHLYSLVRQTLRANRGCCEKCGYDLTGNTTGRCSECGAESADLKKSVQKMKSREE